MIYFYFYFFDSFGGVDAEVGISFLWAYISCGRDYERSECMDYRNDRNRLLCGGLTM